MKTQKAQSTPLDILGKQSRTHCCGELRPDDVGQRAVLMGWVHRRRDLGSLIFVHLRDRSGVTQIVFNREVNEQVHAHAELLRSEYVIGVEGLVVRRSDETVNLDLATGKIDLVAEKLWIFNESRTPPFSIEEDLSVSEEARLKYRYLDLRRPQMQRNIELRHRINFAIRENLDQHGFLEIETPFMTRSTPEGARDFLVPSRLQTGSFFALPQSPQLFKQLLMIGGYEKYFQIVRCFRDEDLRADRQPEFTQVDLEMSFVQQDDVLNVVESLMVAVAEAAGYKAPRVPFLRITHDEAIEQYGTDKPDTRLPPMVRVNHLFPPGQLADNMPLMAIRVPSSGKITRRERDDIKAFGAEMGLRVFDDIKRLDRDFSDPMVTVRDTISFEEGDLLVLVTATVTPDDKLPELKVMQTAGNLRQHLIQKYADRHRRLDSKNFKFLWVTEFPMFEWDSGQNRWNAAHHPFTSVNEEDIDKLTTDPARCRSKAYDLVLNGTELGSGSIRIHQRQLQSKIFNALGFSEDESRHRFGFFLEALEFGTPPHGGIALGLDRLIMLFAGETTIRDVIPFPKTAKGTDLMCEAPNVVPNSQLDEIGISLDSQINSLQMDRKS